MLAHFEATNFRVPRLTADSLVTIQAPGVTKAEWIDDYFRTLSILDNHVLIDPYSGMSCHNDLVTSVTIPSPYRTYRMI